MNISVLCSSINHPVYPYLEDWVTKNSAQHDIELVQGMNKLSGGDILLLISCSEIIGRKIRDNFTHCLVIHASNLPEGRGWSPHIWQILEGKKEIVVSLIEVEDVVDSGAIWKQEIMMLQGHELYDEINSKLFESEIILMDYAVSNYASVAPVAQRQKIGSYYKKRSPRDSEINPKKSLSEQFDLLRVSDPDRYPAYFELNGYKYKISLEKLSN